MSPFGRPLPPPKWVTSFVNGPKGNGDDGFKLIFDHILFAKFREINFPGHVISYTVLYYLFFSSNHDDIITVCS